MIKKTTYFIFVVILIPASIFSQVNQIRTGVHLNELRFPVSFANIGEQKIFLNGDSSYVCKNEKADSCFNKIRYKVIDQYGSCIVLCVNDAKKLKIKFYFLSSKKMFKIENSHLFGPDGELIRIVKKKIYCPRLQKIENLDYDGKFETL